VAGLVVAIPFSYNFPTDGAAEQSMEQRQQRYFQTLLDRAAGRNTAGVPIVLMAHLAVADSDFTGHAPGMEGVPVATLGEGYDYAALGHIHRPQHPGGNPRVRYCGTPIPVSFDEQCPHSVSVVTIDRHGDEPRVTTIPIVNSRPLHTIPASQPVLFEQALELLKQEAAKGKPAYIRLNVLVDGFLPTSAREQAAAAVKSSECRYCTTVITNANDPASEDARLQLTVEQLQQMSPMEVARHYILERTGREMTPAEQEMLNTVINMHDNEEDNP